MRGVIGLGWEQTFKVGMSLFHRHPFRAETEAARHTIDMRIHWKGSLIQ